jgi:5'-nucleotidase
MSNALTIGTPIEVARDKMLEEKYGIEAWAVGGTPADSAKLYIEAFMTKDRPVDLVVSGINHGANLATDIIYSGTVGAAMEGYFHDIPSFALSLDTASKLTYDEAAEIFARDLAKLMPDAGKVFLYNVNFPLFLKDGLPQYVYGRQGKRDYLNAFTREERDGKVYYTMAGEVYDSDKGSATDIYATEQGYISITPLVADMTDYVALDQRLEK